MSLKYSGYFMLFGAALIISPSQTFASQVVECNYALSSLDRYGLKQKDNDNGVSRESKNYSIRIKRFLIIADDKKSLFISDEPTKKFECLGYNHNEIDQKLTCIYRDNKEKEDYQFRISIHSKSGYFDASEILSDFSGSRYTAVYSSYVGFCERGKLPDLFDKGSPF